MKLNTLIIGKEAYFYLNHLSREQRGTHQLSPEFEEKMWKKVERFSKNCFNTQPGETQIDEYTFGGARNGKWVSWYIDDLKEILDEAGYPYKEGQPVECTDL